jgi:hypothetical protein
MRIKDHWDHVWYRFEEPQEKFLSRIWYTNVDPPYHRGKGIRVSTRWGAFTIGYCWDNPDATPESQLGGRGITVEEWIAMKKYFSRETEGRLTPWYDRRSTRDDATVLSFYTDGVASSDNVEVLHQFLGNASSDTA